MLYLNCTALSRSESSNFFHVYYYSCNTRSLYSSVGCVVLVVPVVSVVLVVRVARVVPIV